MRQNFVIALLSVIATLLFVLVLTPKYPVLGQMAGGNATVGGEVAVATGALQGGAGTAFWLYERPTKRLAVYVFGNAGLELKAVRDIQYDLQADELSWPATAKQAPSLRQVKDALKIRASAAAKAAATKPAGKKAAAEEEKADDDTEEEEEEVEKKEKK